jgi:hypothetical protein
MKATHQPPTLDNEPGMTPADLLRGAAGYLRRYGWTQGEFYDLLADTDGPFPPACTSGAIITAAYGRCVATGICTLDGDEDPETVAAIRAMRVFAAYLDPDYAACAVEQPHACDRSAIDVIGDWNDHDGRTLTEVVEVLTDAADEWDRTHHTGGAR